MAGPTASRSDRQIGRSDRQQPIPKTHYVLGGLTATMAGQTATYLTELKLCRKRVFPQTINAIAN